MTSPTHRFPTSSAILRESFASVDMAASLITCSSLVRHLLPHAEPAHLFFLKLDYFFSSFVIFGLRFFPRPLLEQTRQPPTNTRAKKGFRCRAGPHVTHHGFFPIFLLCTLVLAQLSLYLSLYLFSFIAIFFFVFFVFPRDFASPVPWRGIWVSDEGEGSGWLDVNPSYCLFGCFIFVISRLDHTGEGERKEGRERFVSKVNKV